MKLKKKDIISSCRNRNTFEYGETLYETSAVSEFVLLEEEDKNGEITLDITANVEGRIRSKYQVSATIVPWDKENPIRQSSCECQAFSSYPGSCKHIAALLLEYNYQEENYFEEDDFFENDIYDPSKEDDYELVQTLTEDFLRKMSTQSAELSVPVKKPVINSSQEMKELVNYYVMKDRNQFCQDYVDGDVELVLTMHLERNRQSFDLKIGKKQKYVVKDIAELTDNIKNMRTVSYGKNLSFIHSQNAFSRESLPIIKLLLDIDSENEYSYQYSGWGYSNSQMRRSISLTPNALDKLMEIYEGRELLVDDQLYDTTVNIPVRKENPKLPLYLTGNQKNQGVDVTMENILLMEGNAYWYILWEECIYICTREYHETLKNFLKLMNLARECAMADWYYHGRGSKALENYKFFLGQKELPAFVTNVLPIITPLLNVVIKGIDLEKYNPEEAVYKIYLDTIGRKQVTCKCEVTYGERIHNIIKIANHQQTYRDIRGEYQNRNRIEKYFGNNINKQECYEIEAEDDILQFLEYGIEELNEFAEVYASDSFKKLKIVSAPTVSTGISIQGGLLEMSWDLNGLSIEELEDILADYRRKKNYHRLKNGNFIRIEENGLAILAELSEGLHISKEELKNGVAKFPIYRALYLDAVLRDNAEKIKFERDAQFKTLIREMKSIEDSEFVIPKTIDATLRAYQENGYQWISTLSKFGFGGILADDMGLGKTLQMITFLEANKGEGTSLVVCPASLVYNWVSECNRFAPELRVQAVIGSAEEREAIIEEYESWNVLITSYDLLRRDIIYYEEKNFSYEVIDEAQYIKNASIQASKAVKAIHSKCRFALTGTPIENRLSELWSIFEYLMPGYLYSATKFKTEFEQKIIEGEHPDVVVRLQRMIKPFILRRLKRDVLKELPDKLEEVVYAKMNKEQEKVYRANEKKLLMDLQGQTEQDFAGGKIEVLAALTRLRQICCDPALCYDNYTEDSAKLETCIELIQNAIGSGHRILLFSQFATMLGRIQERLDKEDIKNLILTGKTSKEERKNLVQQFQEEKAEVFLISLKAGGTGLNLTAADIVIHFDPWWNVAAQNQATDRAHRIGQENVVTVIKLIAKDTIEERILKLQEKKKDLADAIISEEGITLSKISKEDLLAVLS